MMPNWNESLYSHTGTETAARHLWQQCRIIRNILKYDDVNLLVGCNRLTPGKEQSVNHTLEFRKRHELKEIVPSNCVPADAAIRKGRALN